MNGTATRQEDKVSHHKRPRLESETEKDDSFQIPVLNGITVMDAASMRLMEDAYRTFQAVYIPKIIATTSNNVLAWTDLSNLFESLDKDQESWCIENGGNGKKHPPIVSPSCANSRAGSMNLGLWALDSK